MKQFLLAAGDAADRLRRPDRHRPADARRGGTESGAGSPGPSLIALILFGMPVVSDNLLLALETGLPTTPPADHPPQAIVVLGAEVIRAHRNSWAFGRAC